jgi:hypothetical protein
MSSLRLLAGAATPDNGSPDFRRTEIAINGSSPNSFASARLLRDRLRG